MGAEYIESWSGRSVHLVDREKTTARVWWSACGFPLEKRQYIRSTNPAVVLTCRGCRRAAAVARGVNP